MGDDVGDGKGISTGSAINCKQACQNSETCKFYSYRDGWARDCYLKRGRRGISWMAFHFRVQEIEGSLIHLIFNYGI